MRRTAHEIIDLCLTKKGDDPIHVNNDRSRPTKTYGLAVDLFESTSGVRVPYFRYTIEKEILAWVEVDGLSVEAQELENIHNYLRIRNELIANSLEVTIKFIPKNRASMHLLTFPWFVFQGAALGAAPGPYLDEISLDGQPFRHL